MSHEYYRKYRPKKLSDVEGQPEVVKQLQKLLDTKKFPHAICLSGPTGSGKTTIARIIKKELNCGKLDFHEYNCASEGGIDTVRGIKDIVRYKPREGDSTIIYLDEAHKLTSREGKSSDSQTSLLKMVEDADDEVYYVLATSEEKGLIRTLLGRCHKFTFHALSNTALACVIGRVLKEEGNKKIPLSVLDAICEAANGSAREALTILEKVLQLDNEEEQLESIEKKGVKNAAFNLVRAMVYQRAKWPDVAKILRSIDVSNPEGLRRFVLACARTELLKATGTSPKANLVICAFTNSQFWENGAVGESLLYQAAYEVCSQ